MPSLFIDIEARYAQFRDAMDKIGKDGEAAAKRIKSSFSGLKGEVGEFGSGLRGVVENLSGLSLGGELGLGALGGVAAALGGVALAVKNTADQADALGKLAQKTGSTTEELSKLQYAASLSDVTNEKLSSGLRVLSKNMTETAAGTGEAKAAFEALGLTQRIQNGEFASSADLLTAVAQKFSEMEDGAGKTALALKIFGDAGADLIPLLNAGADGLASMADEAERFGVVISGDLARKSEQFNDNITRLATIARGVTVEIGSALIPALADLLQNFLDGTRIAGGFWNSVYNFGLRIDPFKSLSENLNDAKKTIEQTEAALRRMQETGKSMTITPEGQIFTKDKAESELKLAQQRREFLQQQQVTDALKNPEENMDPRDRTLARLKEEERRKKAIADNAATSRALGAKAGGSGAAASDPSRAILKNQIDQVEKSIQEEQELLASRNKMLERYNQEGYLSFKEFYETRTALQQEALDKTLASYDQEVTLLTQRLSKVKDEKERLEVERSISDVQAKRNKVEKTYSEQATSLWFDQKKAAEQYERQLMDITTTLLELQGRSSEVSVIKFEQQTKDIRTKLTTEATSTSSDEESRRKAQYALEQLDAAKNLAVAQSESNRLRQEAEEIQRRLDTTEKRLSIDRQAGVITELDMMTKVGEARTQSVEQLKSIAVQMENVARISEDKRMIQTAEEFKLRVDELSLSANVLGNKLEGIFKESFTDSFADVISGTKSISEAFNSMANSILQSVNRIIAQNIAETIFGQLTKGFGGAGGGGGLSGILGSIFGGGGGGPTILPSGPMPEVAALLMAKGGAFDTGGSLTKYAKGGVFGDEPFTAFATGGVVTSPTLFKYAQGGAMQNGLMGEAGPEAILPLQRGADGKLGVKLHDSFGGGGDNINVNFNVHGVTDADSFRRSQGQILGRLNAAVGRGRRNV